MGAGRNERGAERPGVQTHRDTRASVHPRAVKRGLAGPWPPRPPRLLGTTNLSGWQKHALVAMTMPSMPARSDRRASDAQMEPALGYRSHVNHVVNTSVRRPEG